MNFYLTLVYGSFAILALFGAGYWGIIVKKVIPFMVFAVIGLFLLVMGFKTSPFKEEK